MFIIEAMMNDHENIRRMMKVMRAIDNDIRNGNVIEVEDVERIIDFLRVYGDEHHHHKEEVILFPAMLETIPMTDGMINGVMLVEHEGGREYVSDLESALLDYKKDPSDSVIRIAPTYPSLDELKKAAEVFVIVTRLVSVNKLLAE